MNIDNLNHHHQSFYSRNRGIVCLSCRENPLQRSLFYRQVSDANNITQTVYVNISKFWAPFIIVIFYNYIILCHFQDDIKYHYNAIVKVPL